MKLTSSSFRALLAGAAVWLGTDSVSAHITYTGRNFGTFVADGTEAPVTIAAGNLSGAFGWADGTDGDLGDSHRLRAFRFKLTNPATVKLKVQGAVVGAAPALQYPAFSLYRGLAHLPPDSLDHDGTPSTAAHLLTLGGVQPKEGAFDALADWKIGNDDVYNTPGDPMSGIAVPASLSSFTYFGHAADGTAANYGTAPNIRGDGLADGTVEKTFLLPAGDYSVFIGGADYAAGIGAMAPYPAQGFSATLTVTQAPEPVVKGNSSSALPGAVYGSIYPPATNGAGTLAFRAGVKVAGAASTIIARRTIGVEAIAQTGTTAAGTSATWKSFGDPVLNDAGDVAFSGALNPGAGATSADDTGVWCDLRGPLQLALREGSPAPGAAPGQLFGKVAWLNLVDGVLYIAAATSDGTVKSSGVWRWDGENLTKVLVPGDSLTLLDGTSHVVAKFSKPGSSGNGNATSRLVGRDATLALLVGFADGRTEIVTFN
jgi:hypothetical protein